MTDVRTLAAIDQEIGSAQSSSVLSPTEMKAVTDLPVPPESLPPSVYGATVTEGVVRHEVREPLVDHEFPDDGGRIVSSREQTDLAMPGAGRFWIERGSSIVVQADAADRPAAWLYATVGAFALAQQGRFALHASVIEIDGVCVAVAGERRAGKSTTSLALARAGHRIVTDDVATLDVEGDDVVHRPAGRPIHVDPATAAKLGVSVEGAVPVTGDPSKLALANPAGQPVALTAVVLLRPVEAGAVGVTTSELSSIEATVLLHQHAYRRDALEALWQADMFAWAGAVANRVRCIVLARPLDVWSVDAVCDAVVAASRARS